MKTSSRISPFKTFPGIKFNNKRAPWNSLYLVHIRCSLNFIVSFLLKKVFPSQFFWPGSSESAIVQRQGLLTTRNCIKKATYHWTRFILVLRLRSDTKREMTGTSHQENKGRILPINSFPASPLPDSSQSLSEDILHCLRGQEETQPRLVCVYRLPSDVCSPLPVFVNPGIDCCMTNVFLQR